MAGGKSHMNDGDGREVSNRQEWKHARDPDELPRTIDAHGKSHEAKIDRRSCNFAESPVGRSAKKQ
jgi:hypothetical protein